MLEGLPVTTTRLATSTDLPAWLVTLACVLAGASFIMLLIEMRRRERGGLAIALTGLLAIAGLLTAVLRPVRVAARESVVGAKVVVLADTSRSMALSDGGHPRTKDRDAALAALTGGHKDARFVLLGFGDGAPAPFATGAPAISPRSDLAAALRSIEISADEPPQAIVVVSDGRLDDPPESAPIAALKSLAGSTKVPIHTVATTKNAPADASIRHVATAGAAVAHVPLPLRVEVGCSGGLACDDLTVTAKELREDGPPALLASGLAQLRDGKAAIDLTVTLERAGPRILEIAVASPSGDTIPENDRRLLTLHVARERVRVLHVAGRATNDVRELRQYLKSDASIDLVAFFILRTPADDVHAMQEELALIPFPVDELFSEHLPSFDAVILQDFDAQPYGLERHLPALARYVKTGGGLIMVGGPNSFVAGGYADTPLGEVLPVALDGAAGATAADPATFTPAWTDVGRVAPLLAPLRSIVGDELPPMTGANILGPARSGGVTLWSHPDHKSKGAPMPVLAVGDEGNGRSIALGIDGSWVLKFSELGARTSGRAYGALWDGLLGWLMRDPRFESAQIELPNACTADAPTTLRVRTAALGAGKNAEIVLDVRRIDGTSQPIHLAKNDATLGEAVDFALPALPAGGYSAVVRVAGGPSTTRDFACEAGGDEWADSRPDPDRLRDIADATGGTFAWSDRLESLDLPKPTVVSAEKHVAPIAPPWLWALCATMLLGAHWYARRRSGLS
jgi:uncharacterized membrane protein